MDVNLTDLYQAVLDAQGKLEAVKSEEHAVRLKATVALNKFNEATRVFDAAIRDIKKNAPKDTDWRQEQR